MFNIKTWMIPAIMRLSPSTSSLRLYEELKGQRPAQKRKWRPGDSLIHRGIALNAYGILHPEQQEKGQSPKHEICSYTKTIGPTTMGHAHLHVVGGRHMITRIVPAFVHSSQWTRRGTIPEHEYMCAQWTMDIAGIPQLDIATLVDGETIIWPVQEHPKIQTAIMMIVADFVARLEQNRPPPIDAEPCATGQLMAVSNGEETDLVTACQKWMAACEEASHSANTLKAAQALRDSLQDHIVSRLAPGEHVELPNHRVRHNLRKPGALTVEPINEF